MDKSIYIDHNGYLTAGTESVMGACCRCVHDEAERVARGKARPGVRRVERRMSESCHLEGETSPRRASVLHLAGCSQKVEYPTHLLNAS
jgi:hypothetical protein